MELLKWAKEKDAYLIEDDYDSEFRYQGRPIPALQSADQAGRVIYLGTFSRAIAPAIRISFLVLPPKLLEKYRKVCGFYSCTVPRSDQEILARWMTDGNFERHLNRMRGIYKEKRNELLRLLEELGPGFTVQGDAAGVHILVRCHNGMSEEEMVQRAEKEQIRVYGVSRHSITGRQSLGASVILGFAGVNQKEMQVGVEGLIRAWKK
jgi:GntR family transcriptional regulator/MocR family aminotransferase